MVARPGQVRGGFNEPQNESFAQQAAGFIPEGSLPAGSENMMNFAAGAISQNVNSRFANAVPIAGSYFSELKSYFEVDNRYVLTKLKTVIFPIFLKSKKWKREEAENVLEQPQEQQVGKGKKFAPPVQDENAPDLYLPLMSFVTYIVVCSYVKGTNGKFTPEVLNEVMYSCLIFQCLEVLIIRSGLYMLSVQNAPLLDLVANTGYKYVGLCINMVLGLTLGRSGYTVALVWTGTNSAYFMLKTLSNNYARVGPDESSKALRMPLLWSFAALQMISIWWLGYSGELTVSSATEEALG